MEKIRISIIGVGNCASSLIQGINFYRNKPHEKADGLMHPKIGPYSPGDIEVVSAFDIDARKIGQDVASAIFAQPNNTTIFYRKIPQTGVVVQMGKVLDSFAPHTENYPQERRVLKSRSAQPSKQGVVKTLKKSETQVLLNYLPVGSQQAAEFYAQCALEAKTAFINCMPVFIASNPEWAARFKEAETPVIGDDVKSQMGATAIHRTLAELIDRRGARLQRTYQLNTGGNTDFLNMLDRSRLSSKKTSKTEAVQSALGIPLPAENIHIGPSDYVAWQKDNKVCFLRLEWTGFGDVPGNLELRLSVEDSPNSGGVTIDAIRCAKLAMERGVSGALIGPSAAYMKHPPKQLHEKEAHEEVERFIRNS